MPKKKRVSASGSVGGVRPCQGRGRGFESRLALLLLDSRNLEFTRDSDYFWF